MNRGTVQFTTGDGKTYYGYVDSWNFNTTTDKYEVTPYGDSRTTYVSGLPTQTFTITGTLTGSDLTQWQHVILDEAFQTRSNQAMQQSNLYEYAVVYEPLNDDGEAIKAETRVLTQPTTFLATSAQAVERHAIRELVEDNLDMDFVVVLVRPFGDRCR